MRPYLQGDWLVLRGCVRKGTARARAVQFEGLYSEVWVPKSVGELLPGGERVSVLWPDLYRVKRWWAAGVPPLVELLAKYLAGRPPRAPGDFRVRRRRKQDFRLPPGVDLADLPPSPACELWSTLLATRVEHEDAAALLGLAEADIHGLHEGRVEFIAADGWGRAMQALHAEAKRREALIPQVLERLRGPAGRRALRAHIAGPRGPKEAPCQATR